MLQSERINHADPSLELARAARGLLDYESTLKRLLDVVLASVGLVLAAPVLLATALAVMLDSPGPAIFVQERVGRDGHRFRFYKFRSMHIDAEQRLAELQHKNEVSGPIFKIRKDPRMTRVGAILRRTSLDELPQLINVLKGDMSMVGPRPPLPREVEQYGPQDMIRLIVKPGLTCLWQVRGRSTLSFETWMEYDREYVRGLSLWLDLKILAQTVGAVITCRGAY